MKKSLLFFTFCTLFCWKNSNAQAYVYHPFPYSNTIWMTASLDIQGCLQNPCGYEIEQLGSDTFINNIEYIKVLEGGTPPTFQSIVIRNDTLNKEVKMLKVGKNVIDSEQVLFDFNLNVGDTLPNSAICFKSQGIVVLKIDSILLQDGTYRKEFKLNVAYIGSYYDSLSLIEGIGYTGGFFTSIVSTDDFEGGSLLACNSVDSTVLYNFAPFGLTSCEVPSGIKQVKKTVISISPNPVTSGGDIIIKGVSENYSLTISNVLGQTVFSSQMNNSQSIVLPDSIKSGVYVCRILTQNNLLVVKKIVVI